MLLTTQPTIAIITALPKEYLAMSSLLENQQDYVIPGRGSGRRNLLAELPAYGGGKHSIILTLAAMGNNIAAAHSTLLLEHFSSIKYILMVGIAGGIPNPKKPEDHVRLGDVVVSNNSGVIQYDFDKETETEVIHRYPPRPPSSTLLEGVKMLSVAELNGDRPWNEYISLSCSKLNIKRPSSELDILVGTDDPKVIIPHPKDIRRIDGEPRIFLGPIASANKLLKNPHKRDALREKFGVKAVEMEASGITDAAWIYEIGYLVVRGICDYCDSRKGDEWQEYAAIVAASYTRCVLEAIPATGHKENKGSILLTASSIPNFPDLSFEKNLKNININEKPQIFTLIDALKTDAQDIPDYIYEYLFPAQDQLFGPSGSSPMWWFVKNGEYSQLALIAEYILRKLSSSKSVISFGDPKYRAYLGCSLLLSLAYCQKGLVKKAINILSRIDRGVEDLEYGEIVAWIYNVKSIVFGKIGNEEKSSYYAQKAVFVSEEIGDYWLSMIVKMRAIHRRDWNSWENGMPISHPAFEYEINKSTEKLRYLDVNSQLHIDAIISAVQALHYSWLPDEQYRAISSAERSLSLLSVNVDKDESVRMISEIGRIKLLNNTPQESISYFMRSAPQRLSSGSLARLRYDLSWLAESYQKIGEVSKASLCAQAGLLIHIKLYGDKKTDGGLVKRLRNIIETTTGANISLSNKDNLMTNSNLLSSATGIDPIWWYSLLKE